MCSILSSEKYSFISLNIVTDHVCVFEDVVAYVDVWSASRMEDYSDPFIQQLLDMGAEVRMLFIWTIVSICQIWIRVKCRINVKSENIFGNCRYLRRSRNKWRMSSLNKAAHPHGRKLRKWEWRLCPFIGWQGKMSVTWVMTNVFYWCPERPSAR